MSFWAGKNVLVTGAGGFVGSWLAHALAERGAAVTAVLRDRPIRSNFQLLDLERRVNVVYGSIADYALLERACNEYEIDTCFHLAAQAIVSAANRSPLSTFESNVKGSWSVLEACRTSPLMQRVVVASSDKAYGDQPVLPYKEDMPLNARYPYDVSKACTEWITRSYFQTYGTPVAVARCANIYGGGDLNYSRLVPGTIRSVLAGERPIIRSDGTPLRDYLYVDDAVDAYLVLGERCADDGIRGEAFNFGADSPVSALALVQRILDVSGASHLEPDIRGVGKASGEIDQQYLDSEKARRVLQWEPTIPLTEGLSRAISWYRGQNN
jgi:CDP-glucose 4,6-dehydratase